MALAKPTEMDDATKARCDVLLKEFEALKSEQVQRISFRDNMLYVTLVAAGAITAFALDASKDDPITGFRHSALLAIPWICVVLGWTYVVNDEKISAIGHYIKRPGGLGDAIHAIVGGDRGSLLGWERAHVSDDSRFLRKLFQLLVDLTTFIVSGAAAMIVFVSVSSGPRSPWVTTMMFAESALLFVLGVWIVAYSGVWKGHGKG